MHTTKYSHSRLCLATLSNSLLNFKSLLIHDVSAPMYLQENWWMIIPVSSIGQLQISRNLIIHSSFPVEPFSSSDVYPQISSPLPLQSISWLLYRNVRRVGISGGQYGGDRGGWEGWLDGMHRPWDHQSTPKDQLARIPRRWLKA